MSFRGRGRGRGRFGGGGFIFGKQEPFFVFPEIELPDPKDVKEERALVIWNSRLTNFWKSSPYYLETVTKTSPTVDIERFSDWGKSKDTLKRDPLDGFVQRGSKNFPRELDGDLQSELRKRGSKRGQLTPKKVRWNPDSDLQKLDVFEKLEQKYQGQEEKGEKEKKEGEEEEEEREEAEAEEEFSDDDDYNQNIDFDDDEDDFNMDDGNDDEPIY